MKKIHILILTAALLLSGCSATPTPTPAESKQVGHSIAATTWPIYCFVTAVTQGADDITVTPVINETVSCLHDYTLTVDNMKVLESAEVIVMNGAGLEDFLSDALDQTKTQVIDCSEGVTLLYDEAGEADPHIWMDPNRAILMVEQISNKLSTLYPEQAELFSQNSAQAVTAMTDWLDDPTRKTLDNPHLANLITFHDGFQYFADAFGLNILKSIEEEEGSEASAKEINEIIALIQSKGVQALFTEENGPQATAAAIARETGLEVYSLSMIMSGTGTGITSYLSAIQKNYETICDAITGGNP